jgi:alpha-galactosidase
LADVGIGGKANVRDLWAHKDLGAVSGQFTATINSHGAGLYRFSPAD